MARLIYIIAILLLIWLAFRYFRAELNKKKRVSEQQENSQVQNVKPCALCGTHIPEKELLHQQGCVFCCQQHLEEYFKKNS